MLLEDTDLLQVRSMSPPGLVLNTYIVLLNLLPPISHSEVSALSSSLFESKMGILGCHSPFISNCQFNCVPPLDVSASWIVLHCVVVSFSFGVLAFSTWEYPLRVCFCHWRCSSHMKDKLPYPDVWPFREWLQNQLLFLSFLFLLIQPLMFIDIFSSGFLGQIACLDYSHRAGSGGERIWGINSALWIFKRLLPRFHTKNC